MIENIGTPGYESISNPSEHMLYCLQKLKEQDRPLRIAEIGVGIGATTREIANHCDENDEYHIFDFWDIVEQIANDLKNYSVRLVTHGNSKRSWDSYSWELAKIFLNEARLKPFFDLIYLDGAHLWLHDAPAACIAKELLKDQGYIIFDDVYWTHAHSPTVNPNKYPQIKERLSDEQINTPHVKNVLDCFIDTDPRFKKIEVRGLSRYRAMYKKTRQTLQFNCV